MDSTLPADELLTLLRESHVRVRSAVLAQCQTSTFEELSGEATTAAGDTVYAIDRIAEEAMMRAIAELIASREPVVVVGEGVDNGVVTLPAGSRADDAYWRIIFDPIDGTRGLMFQKRPAWILSAAAPNRGDATSLVDIRLAVQTEIPLLKQHLWDSYWAIKSQGARGERFDCIAGKPVPLECRPSAATSLIHGYGTVCSFFAGGRDLLGRIADLLSDRLLAGNQPGEARIFEDQYASTGGQVAGLVAGQDRFVADVRPLLLPTLQNRGDVLGHCCHPYDICTKLIAEEAGVIICLPSGEAVTAPLDTDTNVTWVGYANSELQQYIQPLLQEVLREGLDVQ